MHYKILITILVYCFTISNVYAQKKPNKAANELLKILKVERIMQHSIMQMLNVQLHYNPNLIPYEAVLREYLEQQMGFQIVREDIIKMYNEQFTQKELQAMVDFYGSEIGQKSLMHVQDIIDQATEMGAIRVRTNVDDLHKMIDDAYESKTNKGYLAKKSPVL